jgi:hypothetical protein
MKEIFNIKGKPCQDFKGEFDCIINDDIVVLDTEQPSNTKHQITQLTLAMQTVLLEKNKRYGNSALEPLNTFSKLSNSDSIKIRLDDKLSRIKNSDEPRTNDVCDLIGYCFLLLISKGITEEEILNLID